RDFRHYPWPAAEIWRAPRAGHAHFGERDDRRGHRLSHRGDAPDSHASAARLRIAGDRADGKPGGQMALHVRWPHETAAGDPSDYRSGLGARSAALAELARLVRPCSRP